MSGDPTEDQEHLAPLVPKNKSVGDGSVDFYGSPANASTTGRSYTGAILFFAVFAAMSLYGVSYNLVLFMVSKMGMSNAAAASHVDIWTGFHDFSPLLVAYIADAHVGRFKATLAFALLYFTGIALLALASALIERHVLVTWLFFLALYLIALGKGFVASLLAFGADQYDGKDRVESLQKSSYFNWYYFCTSTGLLLAVLGVVYVGDRRGFSSAILVCAGGLLLGTVFFTSALKRYRYRPVVTGNPYASILREFKNSNLSGVLVVWLGSVVYEAMRAQTFSLFVQQANLMETYVGSFHIPPASLNCFDPISVLVWTVIYDRIMVPAMRRMTGNPRGFTFFQRMGTGLIVMTTAMGCAAVLEMVRLEKVHNLDTERLSVLWQIPQFAFVGGSKVFYYVGLIEFLYDQVPENMKTLGTAMSFLSASVGSFLSGFLVSITSSLTGGDSGWIPRDLNTGHLDYFFWMLVVLGVLNWLLFMVSSYTYVKKYHSTSATNA